MVNGFLLQPARPVEWFCGHTTHSVDDDLMSRFGPHIRLQMIANGSQQSEYCIVRTGGQGAFIPCSDYQPPIDSERRELLRDICIRANSEIALFGFWVFAWDDANRPDTWFAMWFDDEGDEHVFFDAPGPFKKQEANGVDAYLSNMQAALDIYFESIKGMEISKKQQFARVLGEKPRSH